MKNCDRCPGRAFLPADRGRNRLSPCRGTDCADPWRDVAEMRRAGWGTEELRSLLRWQFSVAGDIRQLDVMCPDCGMRDVWAEQQEETGQWVEYTHYPCEESCQEQGAARRAASLV